MKIYKLDIDTAQPTNQVVQMQQNTTGFLSVNVTKNGNYIHNLSCTMYDGANEISATDGGFKVDVGAEPKHVKIEAKSTPIESIKEYIASYTPGMRTTQKALTIFELPVGIYNQDEFLPLLSQVPPNNPFQVTWFVSTGSANFDRIVFVTANPDVSKQIAFFNTIEDRMLDYDELITVTEEVTVKTLQMVKVSNPNTIVLSSVTYPAIGYYTDYQMDTLIKPSTNANAYSEQDILPTEADFAQLSADNFTLSGVTYVPTTLSVDGVVYTVLAAPVETPEPPAETTEE